MKKLWFLILLVGCLAACSSSSSEKPKKVTAAEVVNMLQNEEQNSFLLYLGSENCYSCEEYQKVIEEVEEQAPFEIYYLPIDLNEEDEDIRKALDELKVNTGAITTLPTTYYFYQGTLQEENKKEGYLEKKELIKWLKNLHILH